MCLIVLAWQADARYGLLLGANRDEFHLRPSAPADWWRDAPQVLGGRDLKAGGAWLGVARSGRYAAVTNYRDPRVQRYFGQIVPVDTDKFVALHYAFFNAGVAVGNSMMADGVRPIPT